MFEDLKYELGMVWDSLRLDPLTKWEVIVLGTGNLVWYIAMIMATLPPNLIEHVRGH